MGNLFIRLAHQKCIFKPFGLLRLNEGFRKMKNRSTNENSKETLSGLNIFKIVPLVSAAIGAIGFVVKLLSDITFEHNP
jgi:hypothetical protein